MKSIILIIIFGTIFPSLLLSQSLKINLERQSKELIVFKLYNNDFNSKPLFKHDQDKLRFLQVQDQEKNGKIS